MSIKRLIASLDPYSSSSSGPRTIPGGVIAIFAYILVVVNLIIYIYTASRRSYPTELTLDPFPTRVEDLNYKDYPKMPPMNCIASDGCFISPQAGGDKTCYYLQQGEALTEDMRSIFYDSDPVGFFQVLSTDMNSNFALSYDFTKITKTTKPLETETLKAGVDFGQQVPQPYKVYRGVSVFNRVRYEQEDGSDAVESWLTTMTTGKSQFTGSNNNCCNSEVKSVDGVTLQDKTQQMTKCLNNKDSWWTTTIQPPASYSTITVVDPLAPVVVFALIGGWLSIMATIGFLFFGAYKLCFIPVDQNIDISDMVENKKIKYTDVEMVQAGEGVLSESDEQK